MTIEVKLRGQTLFAKWQQLAEKSLGKLYCSVTADAEWDDLALSAIFRVVTPLQEIARQVTVTDLSAVPVPAECIVAGDLYITFVGVAESGAVRLATADMRRPITIDPVTALAAQLPGEVTPEQFDQLLALIGAVSNLDTGDKSSLVAAINEVLRVGTMGPTDVTAEFVAASTADSSLSIKDFLWRRGAGWWCVQDPATLPAPITVFVRANPGGPNNLQMREYVCKSDAYTYELWSGAVLLEQRTVYGDSSSGVTANMIYGNSRAFLATAEVIRWLTALAETTSITKASTEAADGAVQLPTEPRVAEMIGSPAVVVVPIAVAGGVVTPDRPYAAIVGLIGNGIPVFLFDAAQKNLYALSSASAAPMCRFSCFSASYEHIVTWDRDSITYVEKLR